MNIYLSFFQSKVIHTIPAYSFWEYYIKNGIREGGFDWTEGEVDWAEGLLYSSDEISLRKWKTHTWEKTVKDIQLKHLKKPISFFLSYLYPHQVDEQAIRSIQKMGIPCVNFFCDNVREFTIAPKEFEVFDLNWVPEYKALQMYKNACYPHIHLPMPMWVAPDHRQLPTIETNHVSFIGSRDLQRWMLFEEVAKKGLPIDIYGNGWRNEGIEHEVGTKFKKGWTKQILLNQIEIFNRFGFTGFLRKINQRNIQIEISSTLEKFLKDKPSFNDYINITKESAVILGVNRYPSFRKPLNNPDTYSRLRDIEAPMLGACYLTENTTGLDEMYEIGSEIEAYDNADDMIEKAKQLLCDKDKRKQMRINAQKKALSNLSISASLNKISNYFNNFI